MATRLFPLDHYDTRHLMIAFVGLLGVVGTWKTAYSVAGRRAAFLAASLLVLTPAFWGHMFMNSKDIPFAVAYIWSVYYSLRCLPHLPRLPRGLVVKLGTALGVMLALRVGGVIPLLAFCGLVLTYRFRPGWFSAISRRQPPTSSPNTLWGSVAVVVGLAYLLMLAFWPWAQQNPLQHPVEALISFSRFRWQGEALLGGQLFAAGQAPATYLPRYFAVKMPEIVLLGCALFAVFAAAALWRRGASALRRPAALQLAYLTAVMLFPVVYSIVMRSTVYDAVRHFLFLVPGLCVLGGVAWSRAFGFPSTKTRMRLVLAITLWGLLASLPLYNMVKLHPYQYVYYNAFAGGVAGANGRYELDYWAQSYREVIERLAAYLMARDGTRFPTEEYRIFVTQPKAVAQHYFPDNWKLEEDIAKADYWISFTRLDYHKTLPGGRPIIAVRRFGTALSLVGEFATKGRAAPTP